MVQNTRNLKHYFNSFNKNCGWRGGMLYFIRKLCKYVSGKLEYKLQTTVPVLCWYFFNGSEKNCGEKRKTFLFLIAKTYDISFYQQFLARVCPTKWEQFG